MMLLGAEESPLGRDVVPVLITLVDDLNTEFGISESWECPVSVSRIPNSRTTFDRRRTLRSSTRVIKTGTTSRPRGDSSAPNNIIELDNLTETNNSTHQVSEGSDQVESPSRYLLSVVQPLTMEPESGHNKAENVMEEVGEGETNMMEEEGGRTNENKMKCISRVGCSSSSFSPKLTKMVEMMENDDDEEIQIWPKNTTNIGYQVKEEYRPILRKIISKHGDIAKHCLTDFMDIRSALLDRICGIISEFETKDLSKIKETVDGIRKMKVDVEWLHKRLTDVLEARERFMQSGMLKDKKDTNKKLIEESEKALEQVSEKLRAIRDEKVVCKENLARAKEESARIARVVGFAKNKVQRFLHCSVVDGLI
ncbi:hypothetical protein TSUD_253910 [Trifolium subterraneum]|uniref:Phospholipase-like protein n=1 Tax=Trifolium subterraneum TaxID=3900 RepID=A0A2Z6NKZ7_TRISU|nr:hypothetical protein TSUD_253910 [Trifolium subterraneum]